MNVISEIILILEEFAEEFMEQNSIPSDVFSFEAGVDEDGEMFVIALGLNHPNVLSQFSRGLEKYTLHSLPTEALISIYEEDGLNKYLEDHVELQMPVRASACVFILPDGYVYQPQGWLYNHSLVANIPRPSFLIANMPTRPAASLLSPYTSGIEPPRLSGLRAMKKRTTQIDTSPFLFNSSICPEVVDKDWPLLLPKEDFNSQAYAFLSAYAHCNQEVTKHVEADE